MKVIDLLNKIANNEEVPKKIKVHDKYYCYDENDSAEFYRYRTNIGNELLTDYVDLNDEVEIIEEDKKIKRILTYTTPDYADFAYEDGDKPHNVCIHSPIEELFIKKINEIIDYLNKGDKE